MRRILAPGAVGLLFSLLLMDVGATSASGGSPLQQAPAFGFQPGAKVKVVRKDGHAFEGKIVSATGTEYQISTNQGFTVRKYLRDIKKITDTGRTDTGGGISYRPVHEYTTTSNQSFQGVYFGGQGMVFEIDLAALGVQKLSIEALKSIEVMESGPAVSGEQEIVVTCPHCGKPIKIRISK